MAHVCKSQSILIPHSSSQYPKALPNRQQAVLMQTRFLVILAIAARACSDGAGAVVESSHVEQSSETAMSPVVRSGSLFERGSRRRFLRTRDAEDNKSVSLSLADEERGEMAPDIKAALAQAEQHLESVQEIIEHLKSSENKLSTELNEKLKTNLHAFKEKVTEAATLNMHGLIEVEMPNVPKSPTGPNGPNGATTTRVKRESQSLIRSWKLCKHAY